jgi:hypothetical protein
MSIIVPNTQDSINLIYDIIDNNAPYINSSGIESAIKRNINHLNSVINNQDYASQLSPQDIQNINDAISSGNIFLNNL